MSPQCWYFRKHSALGYMAVVAMETGDMRTEKCTRYALQCFGNPSTQGHVLCLIYHDHLYSTLT